MSKETLTINGKETFYEQGQMPPTLAGLLDLMKIDQATVVAEIDMTIIERKNFAQTKLASGQKIELIRFVGGG